MLLLLQTLYLVAALAWISANAVLSRRGGRPLTPTAGRTALLIFTAYGATLLIGHHGAITVYRVLMVGFVLLIGNGGVLAHLRRYRAMDQYRGRVAWLGAIAMNGFGLAPNVVAALRAG